MVNPINPSNPVIVASLKKEASRLGYVVDTVEVAAPAALDPAFEQLRRKRPDLLIIVPDNALYGLSESIMSRALAERFPTMATAQHMSLAGAIITYGFHRREAVERTGFFLKK